jgi:hypothetical protein
MPADGAVGGQSLGETTAKRTPSLGDELGALSGAVDDLSSGVRGHGSRRPFRDPPLRILARRRAEQGDRWNRPECRERDAS